MSWLLQLVEINGSLHDKDISIEIEEEKKPEHCLAQIVLRLAGGLVPAKDCRLVLNINASGGIHPVFLIPHSGRCETKDVDLHTANAERLSGMIVEFLEQVVAHAEKIACR